MNLISCRNCGVVIDTNRLDFEFEDEEPDVNSKEHQKWHNDHYVWNGDEFIKYILCPVCNGKVREDGGMV